MEEFWHTVSVIPPVYFLTPGEGNGSPTSAGCFRKLSHHQVIPQSL